MKNFRLILATYVLLCLTACGGGSGGGGTTQNNNGNGPSVISTNPAAQATEVPLDATMTLTFDVEIDCPSFESAFLLEDENQQTVDVSIDCTSTVVTITPTDNLAKASEYNVGVSTALMAANNGPSIASAFSTTFTTVERVWAAAVNIGDHGSGSTFNPGFPSQPTYYQVVANLPSIAMNDDGYATVTWQAFSTHPDTGFDGGYGAVYSPGYGWDNFSQVTEDDEAYMNNEAFPGMFASGNAVAVSHSWGNRNALHYSENISGVAWTTPETIIETSDPLNEEINIEDFSTNSFRSMVAYLKTTHIPSTDGYEVKYEILTASYTDGLTWQPEKFVETTSTFHTNGSSYHTGLSLSFFRIALNTNGDAIALYSIYEALKKEDSDGYAASQLCVSNKLSSASWPDSLLYSECTTLPKKTFAVLPKLVMDDLGNGLVVWVFNDVGTGDTKLQYRRYQPTAGWGPVTDVPGGANEGGFFDLAMNSHGEAILVFRNSLLEVDSISFSPISGWGSANSLPANLGEDPKVAINDDGDAIVSFVAASTPRNLVAQYLKTGQHWSSSEVLSTSLQSGSETHDVEIDEEGNAIVVWSELKPGQGTVFDSSIWARRFE